MDSQKHTILVPTDFTEISEFAVEYAVRFSKLLHREIILLHILKKDSDYKDAERQISEIVEKINSKHGIKPHTILREGTIFTAIGEVSNELNAEMVIMGTHGIKGLQKFTGSWALKVITKSKAPVLVVHDFPTKDCIEKIVFPIDFKKENREKISKAAIVAKLFNAKIYIFKSTSKVKFLGFIRFNDKGFLNSIFSNIKAAEKYFKANEIPYEIAQADPQRNFAEATVDFAHNINADIIVITTTKAIDFSDYILGASEQMIIDNPAKIPVMCVNPRPTRIGSFSAGGG